VRACLVMGLWPHRSILGIGEPGVKGPRRRGEALRGN